MHQDLEVHIFGNGIGESIVLRLPDGGWGVVDVYVPSLDDPKSSSAFRLLSDRGVKTLKFLCMTHADSDHYRGMTCFLDEFKVEQFWIFAETSPKDIYRKIAIVLKTNAETLNSAIRTGAIEDADEFTKIMKSVRNLRESQKLELKLLSLGLPLYRVPSSNSRAEFRITALGPHGNLVSDYNQQIEKAFSDVVSPSYLRPRTLNHNLASGALLIQFGQSTIVLGGDMESEGWAYVLSYSASTLRLGAQLVKVSHHGSVTGYCSRLWEDHLSRGKSATAVITAFSRHRLPRPEGLKHISGNSRQVFTTSLTAIKLPSGAVTVNYPKKSSFRGFPPETIALLDQLFASARIIKGTPQGVCSFIFDDKGGFHLNLGGDACKVDISAASSQPFP